MNIDKLKQELADVGNIMTQNYEMIFNRGNSLNRISSQSQMLKEESKKVRVVYISFPKKPLS